MTARGIPVEFHTGQDPEDSCSCPLIWSIGWKITLTAGNTGAADESRGAVSALLQQSSSMTG